MANEASSLDMLKLHLDKDRAQISVGASELWAVLGPSCV